MRAKCRCLQATSPAKYGINLYMRLIARLFPMLLVVVAFAPALAQLSGSRDLTVSWRAPEDHVPSPSLDACPAPRNTISNGAVVNGVPTPSAAAEKPDKIELTIVKVSPAKLQVGKAFTATLRLKNASPKAVRIPWQPDGEQVVPPSADGSEQYEVADVDFHLATTGKTGPAMPLETEGALFAHPSNPATYFTVEPGRWVDIILKGTVACGISHCIGEVKADEHATLTARWYQRLLTHQVNGCNEDHGAYTVREVDSAPIQIAVEPEPGSGPGKGHTEKPDSPSMKPPKRMIPEIQSAYPSPSRRVRFHRKPRIDRPAIVPV